MFDGVFGAVIFSSCLFSVLSTLTAVPQLLWVDFHLCSSLASQCVGMFLTVSWLTYTDLSYFLFQLPLMRLSSGCPHILSCFSWCYSLFPISSCILFLRLSSQCSNPAPANHLSCISVSLRKSIPCAVFHSFQKLPHMRLSKLLLVRFHLVSILLSSSSIVSCKILHPLFILSWNVDGMSLFLSSPTLYLVRMLVLVGYFFRRSLKDIRNVPQ
jgi:hypothetical protein